jgi:RluA family pseudouridine synthase
VTARVILADDSIVALDKPVGLLTIPGRKGSEESLWRLVERQFGHRLFVVHRLDRETSGVVVFARSAETHRVLSQAFEHRRVEKHYRARVFPAPPAPEVTLRSMVVSARRGFMRVAAPGEAGREAVTDLRVLGSFPSGEALLDLQPHTGRTHQLRLQLAELGSPIVGEPHYRQLGGASALPAERLWLHALSLDFEHPATGERVSIEAPAPDGLVLD